MPGPQQNKLYRTFVKGLVTEASPLTYPQDASFDEDNCVLYRKGNRSRRLGIDLEGSFELSHPQVSAGEDHTFAEWDQGVAVNTYQWLAAANDGSVNFEVIQIGKQLYIYDLSAVPVSSGLVEVISLSTFASPSGEPVLDKDVSMVAGKGILFVAGEHLNPFYVEYNPDTGVFTTTQPVIQVRDFIGIALGSGSGQDTAGLEDHPTTLTKYHEYNLRNQGWQDNSSATSGNVITSYFNEFGNYPSNVQQWWVGKNDNDDFKPKRVERFDFGNSRAPQGHFILNAFYKDRSSVSGVGGLTVETTSTRPSSVGFFSGRVWWVLNSTVYFSQVFDDKSKIGYCYQTNDPTSEDFSDLLDTDGGTIEIPEIGKGIKVFPAGSGILIFGTNGIWLVSGGTSGFSAKEFIVSKISPIGTESANSIIESEGQIFWWSKTGIQGMAQKTGLFGPVEGNFDKLSLSEQTIQTYYNEIPSNSKIHAKAVFDPVFNTIVWMYKDHDQDSEYLFNKLLIFDLSLQAFYPWSVSSFEDRGPYILGAFASPRLNTVDMTYDVIVGSDDVIVGIDDVTVTTSVTDVRAPAMKFIIAYPETADSRYSVTMGQFDNGEFADWTAFDPEEIGASYTSFLETGYELLEDAMRAKQANYVFTYFRRTEENFVTDGDDFTVDKPSSCTLTTKWDWTNSSVSNKWSTPVEAYRILRIPFPTPPDLTFNNGYPVVVNKHKVRGRGKSIQFRFENGNIGSDFDLLGWSVPYTGSPVP